MAGVVDFACPGSSYRVSEVFPPGGFAREPGSRSRRKTMRFMVIVKATRDSEKGVMPAEKLMSEMQKYHEELQKAGVLLDASGLKPSKAGWRVKYSGSKRSVIDGPFAESKE